MEHRRSELEELSDAYNELQFQFDQFRLHLPEAFVEIEFPAMRVSYMNQVACALLGYSESEVAAGIEAFSLLDARSLVEVLETATVHMSGSVWVGRPYEREKGQRIFQLTMLRKDGSSFPADVQGSYVLDAQQIPRGVRYIFRDTTDREASEHERARLAALVESSDDAIISRGLDGAVLSWNSGAERMYGYTAEEMIGQDLSTVEPPEIRGQLSMALSRQLAGDRRTIETKRLTRDGRVLDVSVALFPVKDSRGEVVAVGGIGRDLGERIRSAEAIRRSNELLETLAAAQANFIRDRDPRTVFQGLLDGLLKLTGSQYGFIGEVLHDPAGAPYLKTYAITNIAWDAASGKRYDDNAERGMEFHNLQTLFGRVLTSGETLIANDAANDPRRGGLPSGHPSLNAFMGIPIHVGQRMLGMVGIANRPGGYTADIADFLRPFLTTCGTLLEAINLELARRAAEERLDLAMRGAELALWEWDVQANTMRAQFPEGGSHGYELSAEPQDLNWLMERVHPEDRDRLVGAFIGHATGQTPAVECEHRVRDGHGEYRWMLTRGMIVERTPSGLPLRAAGTFLDITVRKLAEQDRERLEQQMRQSQKLESLGVFAGGIAHDFNNLLTAVLGNLYLLRQDLEGGPAELADEASRAAERGAELVRRLLTFARPEVERAESVSLDRLLDETVSLARSALTPSIRLVVRRSGPDGTARGSWISLQQVLLNLLVNARDAMPDGGTMTITRRSINVGPRHRWAPPELPRGRYHVITVADTGHGMAPHLLDRIFDPFFTTKDIGRGSGLGLSTALGIARAHGGWLAVETTPGTGSEFRLLLPVEATDATAP